MIELQDGIVGHVSGQACGCDNKSTRVNSCTSSVGVDSSKAGCAKARLKDGASTADYALKGAPAVLIELQRGIVDDCSRETRGGHCERARVDYRATSVDVRPSETDSTGAGFDELARAGDRTRKGAVAILTKFKSGVVGDGTNQTERIDDQGAAANRSSA